MNIFVAFFVLLLLLADVTPPAASSVPLIGNFTSATLHRGGSWKKIFGGLAPHHLGGNNG